MRFHSGDYDVFVLLEVARVREITERLIFRAQTKMLSNGTKTLTVLTQTLVCCMKSLRTQFNFCQQSDSTATMDVFNAPASV